MKSRLINLCLLMIMGWFIPLLTGCGDKDNPLIQPPEENDFTTTQNYKNMILGTWYQYTMTSNTKAGGEGFQLIFHEDNTYSHFLQNGSKYGGTYEVSDEGEIALYSSSGVEWWRMCGRITDFSTSSFTITDKYGYGTITFVRQPGISWGGTPDEPNPTPDTSTQTPKDRENTQLLLDGYYWHHSDISYNSKHQKSSEISISFQFWDRNNVTMAYSYTSYSSSGIWGSSSSSYIIARGSFKVNGNKLTCQFSDVSVADGNNKEYLGWKDGESRSESYEIDFYDSEILYITLFNYKRKFEVVR